MSMVTATLGDALRTQRKAHGLTIEALAAKSGVHRTTISRWEREKSVPFAYELSHVLAVLNLSRSERQVFYQGLEAPRAVHVAGAGGTTALPVSSGELLRALRQRARLSQRNIAHAVNVAQSLVVKWEKGECWPSGAHLHVFCFAVGATTDELVFLSTRAWRYIDPLPLDKEALDDFTGNLDIDTNTAQAGTYLALAARYHNLYRAGKISEVEASSVYGSYAHYLTFRLRRYKEARQIVAPALAGLMRSRGTLSLGQIDAVDWQIECGDTPDDNDLNNPGRRRLNKPLEENLALLNAVSGRYPARFKALHNCQIARTWERGGNIEAASVYYERSVTSARSEQHATHRSYASVEFLCRQGRFRQAASLLRPAAAWSWETRPLVHIKNWCNHAEVLAGLGDFAEAEGYLAQAVAHARGHDLEGCSGPEFLRIARSMERGRSRRD